MKPDNIINIPLFVDSSKYDRNVDLSESAGYEHCPCCGKAIKNPKYFINSIYGGSMYPKTDWVIYDDAWVMAVGSECRKKLPSDYVMTLKEVMEMEENRMVK